MEMWVFVLVMVLVGTVSVLWFAKRQPPSREQIVAAVAALVGSILVMGMPRFHGTAWFYLVAVIAMLSMVCLFDAWRRRPPQVS